MMSCLRTQVEIAAGRKVTDQELKDALEVATVDIMFNKIKFKKKSHLSDTLLVVAICAQVAIQ